MIEDAAFRARAASATEARMRDTCSFSLPGSGGSIDPVTGWQDPTTGTVLYTGPCRLHMPGRISRKNEQQVIADVVVLTDPVLSTPLWAPALPVGAIGTITSVDSDDPGAHLRLNLRMRVVGRVFGTDMTAQRVTVEVVTG